MGRTMRLSEIPTLKLRRIVKATEQVAGAESESAAILRRELLRREQSNRDETAEPVEQKTQAVRRGSA